jgi:cytochrome P450
MTTLALRRAVPRAGDLDAALGGDTLAELVRQFKLHGDAFRMHAPLLGRDVFVLSHPDHVRHLLVDQHARFEKGIGIERVRILLGNGLMTSEGALWRSQRKAIQPAFHRQRVEAQVPAIVAANERLATRIAAAGGEPFDLGRHLSEITLEIVLRALFGDTYDALVARDNPFALLTDEAERDLKFAYALRKLGGLLQAEIDRRRAHRDTTRHDDLLQALIDARDRHSGEPMSDRQIRDEVFTLVVAGHETTASALCWTWYLVAGDPAVAAAVRAEASAASDADRTHPAADRFPHAYRAIAEALRLDPPGWVLRRRALEATSIARVDVERGDDKLVYPIHEHRHPP